MKAWLLAGTTLLFSPACSDGGPLPSAGEPVAWAYPRPRDPTDGDGFVIAGAWPIAAGTIDGEPARILLDTGAQGHAVDRNFLARAFGVDDPSATRSVDVEVLGRDPLSIDVAALDFSVLGWSGFDVVVGTEVVAATTFAIDYREQRAWLGRTEQEVLGEIGEAEIGAKLTIALREADKGWREATCRVEGEEVEVLIDTGASVVTAEPSLVAALGTTLGTVARPIVQTGTFRPNAPAPIRDTAFARVKEMSLGDARVENLPLWQLSEDDATTPPAFRSLLGTPFFRHFLFFLDAPNDTLTLYPYLDPYHVRADEFVRLGFLVAVSADGDWTVQSVFDGSPAARVLEPGDAIVSINGVEAHGDSPTLRDWLLASYAEGDDVPVEIERAGERLRIGVEVTNVLPDIE